ESAWAKAQKDAIFYLKRYALDRTEEDYRAFERAFAVPLAARHARDEMAQPRPDIELVKRELVKAGNHPDDIDGMVQVAYRMRNFGHMQEAIALWKQSDQPLDELAAIAAELREQHPDAGEAATRQALYEIDRIQARVSPHQERFAEALGESLRAGKALLLTAMLMISAVLLLIAVGVSRRFVAQSDRLQRTLRENEAQLRNLIDTAPLPLIIVRRRDERLLYANERALQQFGLTTAQARGRSVGEFFATPEERDALMQALERQGSLRDREVEMQD